MASRAPISLIMLIVFCLAFVLLATRGEAARILSNTPQKDGGTGNIGAGSIHGSRSLSYPAVSRKGPISPPPRCTVYNRCNGGTGNIGAGSIHGSRSLSYPAVSRKGPFCNRKIYANCLKPISPPRCRDQKHCGSIPSGSIP